MPAPETVELTGGEEVNAPSVMSSTSPLSPKHLSFGQLDMAIAPPLFTYCVNFHVGEFASLSTILADRDSGKLSDAGDDHRG